MTKLISEGILDPAKDPEVVEICPGDGELKSENNNLFSSTIPRKRDCAVYIRNVCKSYDNVTPILQNFCMTVKKGTIHGLLGSSGCGKTTMLSCIVGLETWESGELLVFGKKPGSKGCGLPGKKLGYMPQDIALYRHLTIREIVQFYGQIYNMSNSEISDMWTFLCQLLELPLTSTLIGNLSGGQKRRASLALAMLHSPELLVLDEPTAGVDPLLRKNIWDHLYKLVKSTGTAVLITTHYIEEARRSNTIGVMRKGRLLVEDSPSNILHNYRCNLLEEAVVHLCREDESKLRISGKDSSPPSNNRHPHQITFKHSVSWKEKLSSFSSPKYNETTEDQLENGLFRQITGFDGEKSRGNENRPRSIVQKTKSSYCGSKTEEIPTGLRSFTVFQAGQRIHGMTKVMLLTFIRNPVYFGLILFLPTIQGILSLLTVGSKPTGLHLGIVNHELANWSMTCDLPGSLRNSCDLSYLSCQYINQLRYGDLVTLDSYETEEQAHAQVHLGKSWGYLGFPENFSESSVELATSRLFAMNESILGSRIHVHLDYSEYIQVSLIQKHLFMSYMQFVQNIAKSCDLDGQIDGVPLEFRPPVYGTDEDDFTGFVIPGVVVISIFGIGIGLTSISHVSDRKEGTITRARSAGLGSIDIICSHFITQALVTLIQLIIWNGILHFVFHFVILGSYWLWIIFCLLVEMLGAILGLFLGQLLKDETQVLFIIIFLYTIFVFFGCVFLPVERMDKIWQYLAHIVPTYLPTEAVRSIVVRGAGLSHATVWPGLVSTLIWIGVTSIFVAIAFRLNRK